MENCESRHEDGRLRGQESEIHFHHPATLRIVFQARACAWLLSHRFDSFSTVDGKRKRHTTDPLWCGNLSPFQFDGPDLVEVSDDFHAFSVSMLLFQHPNKWN